MRIASALVLCLLLGACYRTHYVNFSPQNPARAPQTAAPERASRGWHHFFIWGLVGEARVDARQQCADAGSVEKIQTQQTFLQGLIEAFAGYLINVYSPWNGAVYCGEPPR